MSVEYYLRNAAGCERMARHCDDPQERALWLRIAKDWLALARLEAAKTMKSKTAA